MTATKYAPPEKVDTLFGEQIEFREYCKVSGYKVPKQKDTRPEIEKQDIYAVTDNDGEITELVCARSHGHARSIYLNIIGEAWDFTSTKLSIKKHSVLKFAITQNMLSGQVDTFDDEVIQKMYALGCYLVEITGDYEDETNLPLTSVLNGDYDDERVYWSIPKSKKICKKNNKLQK